MNNLIKHIKETEKIRSKSKVSKRMEINIRSEKKWNRKQKHGNQQNWVSFCKDKNNWQNFSYIKKEKR